MKTNLILVAAASLTGCSPSITCASATPDGIVAALQPDEQFRSMLRATSARTQTVQALQPDEAKWSAAVDRVVQRHSAAWRQNLESAWASLSATELSQACAAVNERDQATLMQLLQRVGPLVQSRNEPLLRQAGVDVLQDVSSQSN